MQESFEQAPVGGTVIDLVKPLRLHSCALLFTAMMLMVSWLVATNHCAFGMMKPTASAEGEHARCHSCPAPAKQTPAGGARECCKSIQGALASEKVGEKLASAQIAQELFALLQVLVQPSVERVPESLVFDHDPPRAVSFAESVLQRSLLSHAPPCAA